MKITGRLFDDGSGRPIEEGFHDDTGAPADGLAAIFPIIEMRDDEAVWVPVATGFFISNNGMFATAKHAVLDDRGQPHRSLAGVQIARGSGRVIIRRAIKIVVHPTADVAVGFLIDRQFLESGTQTVNPCFALTTAEPPTGAKVVTMAFPKSQLRRDEGQFQLQFTTNASEGVIEAHHPEGRDRILLPGRCYQTSLDIASGASGGPVAFGAGWVFGINSTGMDGVAVGYVSSVVDLLGLEVRNVRLPDGQIRESVSVSNLAALGLVVVRGN